MQLIASKVFVIFIYIGIGFVANKLRVLPISAEKHLIALVLNITTPCLMISSICSHRIDEGMFGNTLLILFGSLACFLLMTPPSLFLARRFRTEDPLDTNVLSVAMVTCNSGFMGFPIAQSVFGNEVFYYLVIQNVAFNLYLFTVGILQLNLGTERGSLNASALKKPFKSFVTVVTLLSVVLLFAGVRIPAYPLAILTDLGDITIPLSMMIVGIQLGECRLREVVADARLLAVSAVKLLLFPALVLLGVFFTPADHVVKLTLVLAAAFPSAVLGVAIAAGEKRNAKLMAEAVASTTLFSMITLPLWLLFLSKLFL